MDSNFYKRPHYSFLAVGKTSESTETVENFKRYIGVGSSFVKAVNPNKAELDNLLGFDNQEPQYTRDGEQGKEVSIHFIVKTDPNQCNGIEITNRLMFTLRQAPAYNRDQSKVQVIDGYGNHTWMSTEDAKLGKPAITANGNPVKLDTKYRMACVGECDLVDFFKAYLCIPDAFNWVNGTWVKKENAAEGIFALEHIKDYFNGDFSELRQALAMQPNNKVKLLYGVRTTDEGKQRQAIASKGDLILANASGARGLERMEKALVGAKQAGSYTNTEFKVQELAEYSVQATNLETAPASPATSDDFWNS